MTRRRKRISDVAQSPSAVRQREDVAQSPSTVQEPDVAQPGAAVPQQQKQKKPQGQTQSRSSSPKARSSPYAYRRNLPHYQGRGGPIFVTFCTKDHWVLPEDARDKVIKHCLHDNGVKIELYCAVVMPDHVHLVYQPLTDNEGNHYSLSEVVGSLKGASAHSVNRLLGRKGPLWQDESFDHVLRSSESLEGKVDYVLHNPVRKGLCSRPEAYPWLWCSKGEKQAHRRG